MDRRTTPFIPLVALALLTLTIASGCQSFHGSGLKKSHHSVPPITQPADVPKELCKAMLPEYVIEPPDILTIDALRLLPRQPYLLQPLDTLSVQISDNLGTPLHSASAAIDPSGGLPLGPQFGSIQAAGITIEELRSNVAELVTETYADPQISIDIVQLALLQQIAGEHLVGPDGKVNLGIYGQVRVAGLNVADATEAIQAQLTEYLDNPKVAVDVFGFNSKVYYVIAEGGGLGDQVNRFPYTGNETVLDAISNVEGLSAVSSKKLWVARPGRNSQGGDQILPVDWQSVTMRGDARTNYQLMPGDRVFVAEDRLVAYDNLMAKRLAPVERLAGVTLLITQALQRLVYFEQQGQQGGAGNQNF